MHTQNSQVVWWGFAATGVDGARRFVAHARDVLASAAPRDWQASSALLYADRLAELVRGCGKVASDVEEADAQIRLLEAQLGQARAAFGGPASLLGVG